VKYCRDFNIWWSWKKFVYFSSNLIQKSPEKKRLEILCVNMYFSLPIYVSLCDMLSWGRYRSMYRWRCSLRWIPSVMFCLESSCIYVRKLWKAINKCFKNKPIPKVFSRWKPRKRLCWSSEIDMRKKLFWIRTYHWLLYHYRKTCGAKINKRMRKLIWKWPAINKTFISNYFLWQ